MYTRNEIFQIATVTDDNQINWHYDVFQQALQRAQNKRIKIVLVVGLFQMGKTSLIQFLTLNESLEIGDGFNPKTNGAAMIGPIIPKELVNQFNINLPDDILDDDVIFFIDIEGFGPFNRGDVNAQNKLYAKLNAPLISISSCIIFFASRNESIDSINRLLSALRLSYHSLNRINANNNGLNFSIKMMTLVNGITNYTQPTKGNYNHMSQWLINNWQNQRFKNLNFSMMTRPFPLYDSNKKNLNQGNSYKNGIKLILSDLLNIIISPNNRINTNNPNTIFNMFKKLCELPDSFDENAFQNSNKDFFKQLMIDEVQYVYKKFGEPKINSIISEYENKQRDSGLFTRIENNSQVIFNELQLLAVNAFSEILRNKFPQEYFNTKEFIDEVLNVTNVSIPVFISNRMEMLNINIKNIKRNQFDKRVLFGIAIFASFSLVSYIALPFLEGGITALTTTIEGGITAKTAVEGGIAATTAIEGGIATATAIEGGITAATAIEGGIAAATAIEGGIATAAAIEGGIAAATAIEGGIATATAIEGGITAATAVEGGIATATVLL